MGLLAVMGPSIKLHLGFPIFNARRFSKIPFSLQNSSISCSAAIKSTLVSTFLILIKRVKYEGNVTGKLSHLMNHSHGCFINKKRPKRSVLLMVGLIIEN